MVKNIMDGVFDDDDLQQVYSFRELFRDSILFLSTCIRFPQLWNMKRSVS